MTDKSNFTEIRRAKLVVNKCGNGNSSSLKLIIPKKWAEAMGMNAEYRDIKLIFENEERIIIEKF